MDQSPPLPTFEAHLSGQWRFPSALPAHRPVLASSQESFVQLPAVDQMEDLGWKSSHPEVKSGIVDSHPLLSGTSSLVTGRWVSDAFLGLDPSSPHHPSIPFPHF
jgi:hypothetical protein